MVILAPGAYLPLLLCRTLPHRQCLDLLPVLLDNNGVSAIL